ncbi:MAG TPA: hypothetical protein PKA64_24090, partial [Myxococcota bacterium]|nr:hypothetical protein [Myxococcota bacterium]
MWWLLAVGCHVAEPAVGEPPWPDPVTTLTATLRADPVLASPLPDDPVFPDGLAAARDQGLGGYAAGP